MSAKTGRTRNSLSLVSKTMRQSICQQSGVTIWLTGPEGAGKSTIAFTLEQLLVKNHFNAYVLDANAIANGLTIDLDFPIDEPESTRRIGELAVLFNDASLITIVSAVTNLERDRALIRELHQSEGLDFIEVFVNTPADVCEAWQSLEGYQTKENTAQYEAPDSADVTVYPYHQTPYECCVSIVDILMQLGLINFQKLINGYHDFLSDQLDTDKPILH